MTGDEAAWARKTAERLAANEAKRAAEKARQEEARRPWWEKERPFLSEASLEIPIVEALRLYQSRDGFQEPERFRRRMEKAATRLVGKLDSLDASDESTIARHTLDCIDWASEAYGAGRVGAFFGGPRHAASVMDGYLTARVVYATSKQRHRCQLQRSDIRLGALAAFRRLDYDDAPRSEDYLADLPIDDRLSIEQHLRLAAVGASIAISEVALHEMKRCPHRPTIGNDYPSDAR